MEETKDVSKESRGGFEVKGKANVRIYTLTEGLTEGNINQMPFMNEYQGERLTSVEYVWNQNVNGKVLKRGLLVSGHGVYGVPTLRDEAVLSCLQNIFVRKKTENGKFELKTENITEDDLKIEFTLTELAREMGTKVPNAKMRESLKKSIETLVATTIFNRYEGGLYDIKTKEYIKNPNVAIHYIESVEGYTTENDIEGSVDVTKIKLSKFFYDSIANDYKLIYKKDKTQLTKNLRARKIYKMALQWAGENKFAWATIDKLIEKIPMNQKKEAYKRQYIKTALDEINNKKMCRVVYDKKNNDKVYFLFDDNAPLEIIDENLYMLDKFTTYKQTLDGIKKLGYTEKEAEEYLDLNIQKINLIQAILRYITVRSKTETINDKKVMFNKYMDGTYTLSENYFADKTISDNQR